MRILVFSDIHANIHALNVLLEKERFDEVVFLGDAVDYGTRPAETVDALRSLNPHRVMGNHDNAVAFGVDCLCAQENHDLSVYTRQEITLKQLSKADLAYLAQTPQEGHFEFDNLRVFAVHGSPSDPLYGYLYPWLVNGSGVFANTLGSPVEERMVLVGHTHYAFTTSFADYRVVNPGSAGQPRDDDRRPSYAVLDTDSGTIELHRFDYPRDTLKKEVLSAVNHDEYQARLLKLFRL
ncbi:MAG: metallophosphoesterase family protein [Thermoprotei archaeon]